MCKNSLYVQVYEIGTLFLFLFQNRKPVKKLYGAGKGVIHKMIITSAGQVSNSIHKIKNKLITWLLRL